MIGKTLDGQKKSIRNDLSHPDLGRWGGRGMVGIGRWFASVPEPTAESFGF